LLERTRNEGAAALTSADVHEKGFQFPIGLRPAQAARET
jgi:hypothetical protein